MRGFAGGGDLPGARRRRAVRRSGARGGRGDGDRWGGGLGAAAVDAGCTQPTARAAGIETVILDVRGNNPAAMALYERTGFVVYGRLPDFVAVGNERFDRVCY